MIDELQVSNIALIREATLVPSAGLTVLTGETGAGKTALLSALKLILGERADSSTVREGETLANVEARLFDGPHDTEGFTVQRSLSAEGRSRVKIDGRIASVRELSERVGVMMDLCGQHEHQRLLDPAHHVAMVDAWAGRPALEALDRYRACLKASRAAAKEVRRVEEASRAQGSRVEEARFALQRIAEVDPKPGEYEELEELLPRSEHAEVLVATANDAHASLAAEGGALDAVNSAVAELSRMATVDRKLGDIADALSDACISLEDCANELRAYRDGVAFDPRELARMRERYSDLKGLLRQWGPTMDDVFAMRDSSRELLSLVDDGDEQIKKAREALGAAERELFAAAKALKRARNTAAPRFCHEVGRQMARLEMGGAELVW
ncbi:MAG: AAA family ATPase, partial [Collinsella sp.]|nr:AAA family ATPase [Collinsella sp.]